MFRIFYLLFLFCACFKLGAQDIPTYYINPCAENGAPQMPKIVIDVKKFQSHDSSYVLLSSKSEHAKRKNKDNIALKNNFKDSNTSLWNINGDLQNKIFGGEVLVKSNNNDAISAKFKIRGLNPKDEDVIAFIKKNCGAHWYASAIAKHESRQRYYVFNQFNSSYYKPSIVGVPNCGLPDGWGIMQIDSARGSEITTAEVYNWQENIIAGIKVMGKARTEAIGYFNAIKRTFPEQWEEPPSHIIINGTKTKLSYLDACVIQLYNGASVVRRLKTAFGTYSYYRSAFEFDEKASSGKRWKFKPNINSYVYKVISHEVEGSIKTENEPTK